MFFAMGFSGMLGPQGRTESTPNLVHLHEYTFDARLFVGLVQNNVGKGWRASPPGATYANWVNRGPCLGTQKHFTNPWPCAPKTFILSPLNK